LDHYDVVSIIDSGDINHPAVIDPADYELDDDSHGIKLHTLKADITNRLKVVQSITMDEPKMRALLWKYMSRESTEAVLKHADYDMDARQNCPQQLYASAKATHPVGGVANDQQSRKALSRRIYKSMKQGAMETIAEYKARFTQSLEAYKESGNVEMPEDDIAMDFQMGLDNARYAKFKADLENDRTKGIDGPQTLTDMYHRASDFVVVRSNWKPTGGAAFATRADEFIGRGGGGKGGGRGRGREVKGGGRGRRGGSDKPTGDSDSAKKDGNQKADANAGEKKKRTVICFNCNEEDHMSYNCPNDHVEEAESGNQFASLGTELPEEEHSICGDRASLC
jgi:hypothetical protein